MFVRNALKPVLRYRSLSTSTSARNAAKSQKQPKCDNLLTIKLRQVASKLTSKESTPQEKSNLRNSLLLITTASKGFSFLPNMITKNRILIHVSKVRGLRMLTQLQYTEEQPPGTYKQDSEGHEKILAEQQRQLEELKNKQKSKGIFNKILSGYKEEFPKYKPKG